MPVTEYAFAGLGFERLVFAKTKDRGRKIGDGERNFSSLRRACSAG